MNVTRGAKLSVSMKRFTEFPLPGAIHDFL